MRIFLFLFSTLVDYILHIEDKLLVSSDYSTHSHVNSSKLTAHMIL
ncbi:hypothetical protein GLYMA_12G210850v4 [Glycine max]|nr:hypothetical protein GLYMA_12G210850v4 [Glycine max]KAH1144219.1 hypothetical protein GYH30_034451 [Glycine max]